METEIQELNRQIQELQKKLDTFTDVYYRTNRIDRTEFNNPVVFNNNIVIGKNGTKFGTSTSDKIAFFGTAAIIQPATISDPSGGATVDSAARTAINTLIDRLHSLGLIA